MTIRPAIWTSRVTAPSALAFAALFGFEAFGRALMTAALPVQTLRLLGSDEGVSALYLLGSVGALAIAFLVPRLVTWLGRGRLCGLAILTTVGAAALFIPQALPSQMAGFILRAVGTALLYAGLSMFIMDHIRRQEFGRSEPVRMLVVGLAWTIGPFAGVQIEALWGPSAPFVASAMVGLLQLAYFLTLRFRQLPIIRSEQRRQGSNPFANLATYMAQPRLVLALLHAAGRGFFWRSFVIYTPLYAVATGLGAGIGGLLVSLGSAFMLLMPLWGWAARRFGIRRVSLMALPFGAASLAVAGLQSNWPWLGAAGIVCGAAAMTVLDGYGNTLFYRACKPSQRTAMSPIFSAQRDLSDITQAGVFVLLLSFFPVQVVYLLLALVLVGLTLLVLRINPRL